MPDFRNYTNIKWATSSRETRLMLATGRKRIGKSKETIDFLTDTYVIGNIAKGIKPRKALIFDVNDEYTTVKSIFPEHIEHFNTHPICEIRRVRPWIKGPDGKARPMNPDEKKKCLAFILSKFKGGALLIEDINKYATTGMPDDILGPLCANAHTDCDIIMHYQSSSRPLPMVWENTGVVRFHYQSDDVWQSQDKLGESTALFKIAQILVNNQYFAEPQNLRYFVWVEKDEGKIIGDFTRQQFEEAILQYITSKKSILQPTLNRIDRLGKPLYTPPQAIEVLQKQLAQQYYGNAA